MEKYHGFDHHFYDYLFEKIVNDGGLRMQVIASEVGKQLIYIGKKHDKQSLNYKTSLQPKIHSTSTANSMATSSKHSKP